MSTPDGEKLLDQCKQHILAAMRNLPECAPDGPGLQSKDIEKAAGLALRLAEQDGWLTWSLLMALTSNGKVEVLRTGKRGIRHFRLTPST
jgi:hypothetical protein